MVIKFDPKARPLAEQTGLDKLGQAKLEKLDKDKDGVVTLTDVRRLTKAAALEKDGSLSKEDRKRIDQALGGKPSSSTTKTTGPSSMVATMGGGKKTLGDTYIDMEITRKKQGLEVKIDGGLWSGGSHQSDKSKTQLLNGFDASAVDVLYYGTKGETGMSNSSGSSEHGISGTCFAAGMLVAVADKARGVVLVDVAARDFLDGKGPPQRKLLSLAEIARAPAVKAFAKKSGLDPKELTVSLKEVWLSAAFTDSKLTTFAFEAKLTDKHGKSKTQSFSTILSGDLSKSLDKLELDKLETGVASSWGYLMPPSAKPKPEKGKAVDGGGGGTGGGESVVVHHHHHTGGGESSGYVPSSGGGE